MIFSIHFLALAFRISGNKTLSHEYAHNKKGNEQKT